VAAVDVDEVRRYPHRLVDQVEVGQQLSAAPVGQPQGGLAVEVQHVEHLVEHRHGGQQCRAGGAYVHAVLQPVKRRVAGLVERDHSPSRTAPRPASSPPRAASSGSGR
jgi:hypothetical protein